MITNKASVIFNFKLLFVLITIISAVESSAQNWTGNLNSDWNNSANWTVWPLNGEDILIDPINYTGAAVSPIISTNSVFTPAGIIVQNGAQLAVQANLTANDRIELFGTGTQVTITAGTLHAAGSGSDGRFIVSDGANVTMNGGILTANQRVIIELGGTYTLNIGTVNAIQELAIGDGNTNGSSLFDMNGGSLITQGIGFENEAGLYYPTFDMSAGTLTVNGDVMWLGVAPGAGTPKFIMTGGTATIQGDILNDLASTVDLFISLSGAANLAFNGSAITLVNPTDSIIQSGTSLFTLTNTNTWSNPGVFTASNATTVFNGNTTLQGTGSYEFNSISINAAKTLNHLSPINITITGDFINNGTFNPNLNTFAFAGTVSQFIGGSNSTSFHNLNLNNTSSQGLTLNNSIIVTGGLQLNNGKLNSSATNLITLTDNATANQGSSLSFVNGPLRKTGNDAFVFPVGKNTKWRRLAITAPASITSEFTGEYFDNSYNNLTPVNTPLSAVTNIEYWKLGRLNSTDNVQASFYWEDAAASAITDCGQISLAYWDNSAWNNVLSNAAGTCTGNGTGSIQSSSPLNNFGIFTFGFYGNVTAQSFTICHDDSISVGTNSYTNSGTYIDILTAADMSDSTVITQLTVIPPIIVNQTVSVCHGDALAVGTHSYSISGDYADTLTSFFGCDSIINTYLTVQNLIDVSAMQNGNVLTSNNLSADSYQWVDCSNNYLSVNNATNQSYTATINGNYAVVISKNNCSDTSACYSVTTVGIEKNNQEEYLTVFPNPSNGRIVIQLRNVLPAQLKLTDVAGRMIIRKDLTSFNNEIDYSENPSGVYFLEIIQNNAVTKIKLIKY